MSSFWRDWCVGILATLVATWSPTAVEAAPLFGAAGASSLIVRGTVEAVTPYDAAKLTVYRIRVGRVLAGEVAAGETIDLAQEMLFANTQPYFTPGAETLVLAVPLPNYSAFRKVLPEGRYWRWTERLEVASDVAPLTEPALTEAVARYLEVRADAEALADFLLATILGPNARLRADALAAIEQHREVPPLLDAARLRPLTPWLVDEKQPVLERAKVLVRLARVRAAGVVTVAEEIASRSGPLQAAAVDALVSLDRVPPAERLLAWSQSPDEAMRVAAVRGLAKVGSPSAMERLAIMAESDASEKVVGIVLEALATQSSPRSVEILTRALAGTNEGRATKAAEALGRLGTPEAIAALGATLEKGGGRAQVAAAFALKRSGKREADEILHHQESAHPDPKVRKLCRLALGESMHEH